MDSFLDPGLRHSHSTIYDLDYRVDNHELPESIAEIYKLCLKAEMDQDFLNSREFANNIERIYFENAAWSQLTSSGLSESPEVNNGQVPEKYGKAKIIIGN